MLRAQVTCACNKDLLRQQAAVSALAVWVLWWRASCRAAGGAQCLYLCLSWRKNGHQCVQADHQSQGPWKFICFQPLEAWGHYPTVGISFVGTVRQTVRKMRLESRFAKGALHKQWKASLRGDRIVIFSESKCYCRRNKAVGLPGPWL